MYIEITMVESVSEIEFTITPSFAEQISKNIKSKFKGTLYIDIDKVVFRENDIRRRRDLKTKKANIFSNGFTQPITINIIMGVNRVINGKTRLKIVDTNKELFIERHGRMIRCEVYHDLTIAEEDYLDVSINAAQSEISAEERYDFVENYGTMYNYIELANILNCTLGRVKMLDFFVSTPKEYLVKNVDGTVNLRQSEPLQGLKTELPESTKLVADANIPLTDLGRNRRNTLVRNINNRMGNKHILDEHEEDIVPHEIEKAERGGLESYQGTGVIPKGSDGKIEAYGYTLLTEKPDKIIMFNIENSDYMIFNKTKEVFPSQALLSYEYAKENDKDYIFINRSELECDIWKRKYPDINIVNTTVEKYLLHELEESDEKVLLYFHLSGDYDTRNILSEHVLEDIYNMIPNAIILSIYSSKWYNDVTKDMEVLNRFGIKRGKRGIHTLKQYLDMIMEQQTNGLFYDIIWGKNNYRSVSLVKWHRNI